MIDTKAILAAVAQEKTENASLRTLLAGNTDLLKATSAKLDAIVAAGGNITVEQIAQIQSDLDGATADLSADNQAAADAITANTLPDNSGSAASTGTGTADANAGTGDASQQSGT